MLFRSVPSRTIFTTNFRGGPDCRPLLRAENRKWHAKKSNATPTKFICEGEDRDGTDLDDWLIAEHELLGEQDRPDTPDGPSIPLPGERTASEPASSAGAEDRGSKPRCRGTAAEDRSSN